MASDDPTNQFLFLDLPDENGRPLALQGNEIEITLEVAEPGILTLFGTAATACFWRGRRRRRNTTRSTAA